MVSVIATISTQRKAKLYYAHARDYLFSAMDKDIAWDERAHAEKQARAYQLHAAYMSKLDRRDRGVE